MPLPESGTITMEMIRDELKQSGAINLGSTECRKLAGKPSGSIKMSDFYGKSNGSYILSEIGVVKLFLGYGCANIEGLEVVGEITPKTIAGVKIYTIGHSDLSVIGGIPFDVIALAGDTTKTIPKLNVTAYGINKTLNDVEYVTNHDTYPPYTYYRNTDAPFLFEKFLQGNNAEIKLEVVK